MAKTGKKADSQDKETFFSEIGSKFKQSPGLYIGSVAILILVVVAFVGGDLLSGGGFGSSSAEMVFGQYNKTPITLVQGNTFAQNYEAVAREFQSYESYDPNDFWAPFYIWRLAYERTVRDVAILDVVKRSNYTLPDNLVDRYIATMSMFQENGRFNPVLYRATPESTLLSIRRQVQEYLIREKFYNDYRGLVNYPKEAAFIGEMTSIRRNFDTVIFNIEDYPESEVLSYASANSQLFDTIHLSKITISSNEREARRILDSIKEGSTTFEEAARNYSQDQWAVSGGDMSTRYLYVLDLEIQSQTDRQNVYGMRPGQFSDIISTGSGWVFYRCEAARAQANFADEAVIDSVRSYISSYQRGRMEDWAISQANAFISEASAQGFNEAAFFNGLDVFSFGPLPVNYGNIELFTSLRSFDLSGLDTEDLTSLSNNENFWKTAFSTPVYVSSNPFVSGSKVFVFIPTEEIISDESYVENITLNYSSWWLNLFTEENMMQLYFLNSERMTGGFDGFWDAFFTYLY